MGFAWDITVPKNTTITDPKEQILKLTYGVIVKIDIKFPRGCHNMVKIRLTRGGLKNVCPMNPDEWIIGDNETVSFPMYYEIEDRPMQLEFTAISPETGYEHMITVRVSLLPRRVASMIPLIELLTKLLTRLFGV